MNISEENKKKAEDIIKEIEKRGFKYFTSDLVIDPEYIFDSIAKALQEKDDKYNEKLKEFEAFNPWRDEEVIKQCKNNNAPQP